LQEFLFFFSFLQEFFAGIPAGQEFLYLLLIPPESGGFLWNPEDSSGFLALASD